MADTDKKSTTRHSAKRELIKQTLLLNTNFVTAEVIWLQLRNQHIRISLSATYKTLRYLTDLGLVLKQKGMNRKNQFCWKRANVD